MKKVIMILLAMFPMIVFGETCEVNKDTQTGNDRTLTCDEKLRTTTTFKTKGEQTIIDNEVCTITCTEEIVFMVDPIKKVLAGTSFSYPLYASGERKCKAEYHYATYEEKIKKLVSEYESISDATSKQTKANEMTNFYDQRKACDEFSKEGSDYENKYQYNKYEVELEVETSSNTPKIQYTFKEMGEYDRTVIQEEVSYRACEYNEAGRNCRGNDVTTSGWTETSRIYGKYTMKDTYLENYTGEEKGIESGKTCNAGDRFFTDLKEISRPVSNDPTDKGYKLTLRANKIGDNLNSLNKRDDETWNLTVNCYYQLKNLIFPQKGDENNDEFEGMGFQYRIIDVNNPFPGREAGANWKGKEGIITPTTAMEKFVITLSRSSINRIREYNDVHSYDTFNLDEMEKSTFIQSNEDIIDRK